MIKLEHVVLASPEQMKFIIEGMRNPMNSWGKSDSEYVTAGYDIVGFDLGESDQSLMQRLSNTGTDHRKFMRMTTKDDRKNAEGYNDPTAYNAIKNVEQEQDKDDARFHQLLNMLFSLCELADFHIEGRVVLKDKRTGKVWR